jgi:hypothetical protein
MGKGLGPLQIAILQLAYKKPDKSKYDFDISARSVLIEYYNFPVSHNPNYRTSIFDRNLIGMKRYMSKSVTVAQCFNRLMDRGLVKRRYGQGIKLTRAGLRAAKSYL